MRKYAITEGERIKLRSIKRMFGCSVKHCPDEVDILEVLAKAAKLTNHAKPEFGVQVTQGRCPAPCMECFRARPIKENLSSN